MKNKFSQTIILTLIIGAALSTTIAWLYDREESRGIYTEFQRDVNEISISLNRELDLHFQIVLDIGSLFKSMKNINRKQFHDFVIEDIEKYGSIQAMEWIPRVKFAEREKYEQMAVKDGFTGFSIREREKQGSMVAAENRPEYFPVYFVEPLAGNKAAVGFDLASSATRLATLESSRDTGKMLATARITLVQEKEKQRGFLVFAPVYDTNPSTVTQRRDSLQGFGLGVFRIGDIFEKSIENIQRKLNIKMILFDDSAPKESQLLYTHPFEPDSEGLEDVNYRKTLHDIAGRQWSILAVPGKEYYAVRKTRLPEAILVLGLIITAMIAGYLRSLYNHTAEIEHLVEIRTYELTEKNAELTKTMSDLERFNRRAIGKEVRMVELKREINELSEKLGERPPYDLNFAQTLEAGR